MTKSALYSRLFDVHFHSSEIFTQLALGVELNPVISHMPKHAYLALPPGGLCNYLLMNGTLVWL